ncbi:MAG: hypothetical protein LBT79_02430 [Elusimicrobiota bacterium]|jgi:hypothetical protein|nr:hypothetical protein [Elusimicrobiota bacterium]
MKKLLAILICFTMLATGCAFKSTTVRYNEKNNDRASVIEKYTLTETKKIKYSGTFQLLSWIAGGIVLYYGLSVYSDTKEAERDYWGNVTTPAKDNKKEGTQLLMIGAGLIAIPFVYSALFSRKDNGYIMDTAFSGQLLDEQGNGIANHTINIPSFGVIQTNTEGFFSMKRAIATQNPSPMNLIFSQGIDESIQSAFTDGKRITFINPIRISYAFDINSNLTTIGTFIEIDESKDVDILKEIERNYQSNNNKIVLRKQEFYSEKNKKFTIAIEKKLEAERIAKEKRIKDEKIAQENFIRNIKGGNLKSYNEDEIFRFSTPINAGPESILHLRNGAIVVMQFSILQVLPDGFLFGGRDFTFYGRKMPSIVKRSYFNGQPIEFVAIVNGTYSYSTAMGITNTVPKVDIYAIRPLLR